LIVVVDLLLVVVHYPGVVVCCWVVLLVRWLNVAVIAVIAVRLIIGLVRFPLVVVVVAVRDCRCCCVFDCDCLFVVVWLVIVTLPHYRCYC